MFYFHTWTQEKEVGDKKKVRSVWFAGIKWCGSQHTSSSIFKCWYNRMKAYHSQICCYSNMNFLSPNVFQYPCARRGEKAVWVHTHTRMHAPGSIHHLQILQHYMKQMSFSTAAHQVLHCLMNANGGHLPVKAYSSTMAHATIETVLLHLRPRQSCMCPD